jgi:ABC-type amino acid transport substrate-binding protein
MKYSALLACITLLGVLVVGCGAATQITVHSFPSTPRAISELKRGWADAVVGDYPVMAHTARESMDTLEVVGAQFATGHFGIAVSKNAPELQAALTDAFRKIVADETYMNVLRKWALHIGKTDPPPAPANVPATNTVEQLKDGKLHVGIELAYAPMEFLDELKKPAGADVELALALGKALGVEVEFIDMPFDKLIAAVQSGQVDVAMSAMTVTPERSAEVSFIPYLEMGSGILVMLGNPKAIRVPEDLCGRKVALQEGTSQVEALAQIHCE